MATALKPNRKPRNRTQRPLEQMTTKSEAASERPVWETVVELGAQISDADWANVPDDSAINYKRHLYGSPSKLA